MSSRRCRSRRDAVAADRISDLPEPINRDILSLLPTKDLVATSILSKSWRLRWQEVSRVDRISNLPESMITEILNHLPTKDAVATSVLSKSWRFRWTEVTTFDVEGTWDDHLNYPRMVQFVEFIEKVFLTTNTFESIRKFRLRWHCKYYFNKTWVSAAISAIPGSVKVLDLDLTDAGIRLPAEILTCKTLEVLRLSGSLINVKLADQVCLPKLAELELNGLVHPCPYEIIVALICGCPVLQSLTVKCRIYGAPWCSILSPLHGVPVCSYRCASDSSPVRLPKCLSSSLKQFTFKIVSSFIVDEEMMTMKFILNHGLVMERVNLCFDHSDILLQEILTIHRASPTCRLYTRVRDLGSWNPL